MVIIFACRFTLSNAYCCSVSLVQLRKSNFYGGIVAKNTAPKKVVSVLGIFCSFAQELVMRIQDLLCAKIPCFLEVSDPGLLFEQVPRRNRAKKAPRMRLGETEETRKRALLFGARTAFAPKKCAPTKRYSFRGCQATWPHC